jgi:hypothetical protein
MREVDELVGTAVLRCFNLQEAGVDVGKDYRPPLLICWIFVYSFSAIFGAFSFREWIR